MAGQGSVAVELLQQLPADAAPDVVIVPVGGGGLIGGVAAVLKAADPAIQVRAARAPGRKGGSRASRPPSSTRVSSTRGLRAPSCAPPRPQVIGAQPAASDVMRQSVAARRIVDAPSGDTLSDATAGGIEPGALTLQLCVDFVDRWVSVSEQEIADALVGLLAHEGKLVEGAAGCGLAAFRRLAPELGGKRVVLVCCGGNIAPATLAHVLQTGRAW